MKKFLALLLSALMSFSLAACGTSGKTTGESSSSQAESSTSEVAETITTGKIGVIEDTKLEALYIDMTIDDFNALGFELGDSVDVVFDNGFALKGIPYFNGFYVTTGAPLAVSYPGAERVAIVRAQGASVYKEAGATADTKVTVTLNEKAKYLTVQQAFSLEYSNNRSDFASDEEFANFRAVAGGKLKENLFYRSASPANNTYSRANCVDALIEKAGIKMIIDLADNDEDIQGYLTSKDFASAYFKSLYDAGKVLPLDLSNNYRSEKFAKAVASALVTACENDGPYLVQCTEGKDRTGFVCTLLLALSGASTDEITADYMATYANYYGVTKTSDPDKYDAIVRVKEYDNLYYLAGLEEGADLSGVSYVEGAKKYLAFGGLTDDQIAAIEKAITK